MPVVLAANGGRDIALYTSCAVLDIDIPGSGRTPRLGWHPRHPRILGDTGTSLNHRPALCGRVRPLCQMSDADDGGFLVAYKS